MNITRLITTMVRRATERTRTIILCHLLVMITIPFGCVASSKVERLPSLSYRSIRVSPTGWDYGWC